MRLFVTCVLISVAVTSCKGPADDRSSPASATTVPDNPFWQEYHQAWKIGADPSSNDIRSVAVDKSDNIWVATASGVFRKLSGASSWVRMTGENSPSFSVVTDSDGVVWTSLWDGVYTFKENSFRRMEGPEAPVSRLCSSANGIYAVGPRGVWHFSSGGWKKVDAAIGRSIRDVVCDREGNLWVGTDVGLYNVKDGAVRHTVSTDQLISAYVRGLAFDDKGRLWAAGLGGVSILDDMRGERKLRPADGLPTVEVNTVGRSPENIMWVGTDHGVVRFDQNFTPSLLFSRRWLIDDRVRDIAFDSHGDAWIATAGGVSAIRRKRMTLQSKADYFQDVLMRRHIRAPWIAGQCKLPIPGDTTVWLPDDDDNDGEYTGNYLAMESFRYAVTKDPGARENAAKAFRFLRLLQEVTGTKAFFARTIVPSDWKEVDDANRTYTVQELAEELVKEPRFKPVETRWHLSADGKWLWKGDTSSDEMCGHMMGYYFYYELVADEEERSLIRAHVQRIVDGLIENNFNFIDIDGTHSRWGVWSPKNLNDDPEWMPDRALNSLELLSFVKLASHVSGGGKYEEAYRRLIDEHGYLDNMARIPDQNPGWFIYYDVLLAAYQYPILLRCEKDPKILDFYRRHLDAWYERYRVDNNPLINFIYCYSRETMTGQQSAAEFLRDTPLDLIDWPIDHTQREDISIVRRPVLDELQVDRLQPASIRGTIRWDKNPYSAISGNPSVEREPVFWLFPYWMGRYLGAIGEQPR